MSSPAPSFILLHLEAMFAFPPNSAPENPNTTSNGGEMPPRAISGEARPVSLNSSRERQRASPVLWRERDGVALSVEISEKLREKYGHWKVLQELNWRELTPGSCGSIRWPISKGAHESPASRRVTPEQIQGSALKLQGNVLP